MVNCPEDVLSADEDGQKCAEMKTVALSAADHTGSEPTSRFQRQLVETLLNHKVGRCL